MKALRTFALSALLLAAWPASALADSPVERMVQSINAVRAEHGLKPLRQAPKLASGSRSYARHLVRNDVFGHGSGFRGAGFRTAGEVLAYSSGWSTRPRPAIRMWLRSPGHRALLLRPSFRYVGTGLARGRFGRSMATVWVARFGAH